MSDDTSAPFLPISGYLESPPEREPPLCGDARADVAIVGGGFTGLSTALALKRAASTPSCSNASSAASARAAATRDT